MASPLKKHFSIENKGNNNQRAEQFVVTLKKRETPNRKKKLCLRCKRTNETENLGRAEKIFASKRYGRERGCKNPQPTPATRAPPGGRCDCARKSFEFSGRG